MKKNNRPPAPLPDQADMDELLTFLPVLSNPGFEPIENSYLNPDTHNLPYPIYHPAVTSFIQVASKQVWCDYNYIPLEAYGMLQDHDLIAHADLVQIRTMLTYIVRGERFSDGHWATMIKQGHLIRLLERLEELRKMDSAIQ